MRKLLFFLLWISFPCHCFSQSYDECLELLKENKISEATQGLEKLQRRGDSKTSSLILLSLIKANQGDYVEAFDNFKLFYEQSGSPYPFMYALSNFGLFNIKKNLLGDDIKDFLEKVIADPRADMTITQLAIDQLGAFSTMKGNVEYARKLYEKAGEVENWNVAGVFENVSGSGFNKRPIALEHPENDYTFTNKAGLPVTWFPTTTLRNNRWCDLNDHFDTKNSIVFAQTFISCDTEKEALMKLGVGGSFKIWLNDFLIGSEQEETNTDVDAYIYKVKLHKGYNRLLLQIGSSESGNSNFLVRFNELDDQLITNITSQGAYASYTKESPYKVEAIPFPYEKYFEDYLSAHPNDIVSKLLLLSIYNKNGKKYKAHKVLALLKNEAPHNTLVSELAMSTAQNDQNTIMLSREKESIITNDPESVAALEFEADDAIDKERWSDAVAILKRKIELYGGDINTAIKLVSVLVKQNDNEGIIDEVNKDFRKYPSSAEMSYYKYLLLVGGTKNLSIADKVLVSYLNDNYDERIVLQLIEDEFKLGMRDEGKRLFRKMISYDPTNRVLYQKYMSDLYDLHDYEEAYQMADKAIALAPYIGDNYYSKGIIYNSDNKRKLAVDMLSHAVAYSPTNYLIRKKLMEIEGKKELTDYFSDNDIQQVYNDGMDSKKYTGEDLVCLLNDKRDIVYPEHGAVEEENELLLLIKSQSAIDKMKEFDIPYNSFVQRLIVNKAEVLKKDGSKVAAQRQNGHCVFPTLETGDAVHLSYKLEDSYSGMLAEHFWGNFYFNNSFFPVKLARYSLIIPADKKFSYKAINVDAEPAIKSLPDNYKLYTWEKKDLPKVEPEPSMPADILQQLIVSSIPDWNYIVNWYRDISNTKTQADYETREQLAKLRLNKCKDDLEKARVIYNYIEQNYHYSNVDFLHSAFTPQTASKTINTKLGDCKDLSTLFVSMAREAGLDANLVLVSTNENDRNLFELPTINFNHCIAQLKVNNKNYFIELTNNYLPFSAISYSTWNALGLSIPNDTSSHTPASLIHLTTENKPNNLSDRISELSFKNQTAMIHRKVIKTGSQAAGERIAFIKDDDAENTRKLTEDINREFNKNTRMDTCIFGGLRNCSDTATLDYRFTVDNYTSNIAGMEVFKIPWTDQNQLTPLFTEATRKAPLDIWFLSSVPKNRETIAITIPEGKKLLETPQDISLNCSAFTYSMKYSLRGNEMIITRELNYLKDRILPDEYATIKATVSKLQEADGKEIAYK